MQRKRIWFSFLSLDCLGAEQYLNEYAKQGWALSDLSDCRTGTLMLERTSRRDLRYFLTCRALGQDEDALLEMVTRMRELGWEPVATVNQFDVYESMPCRDAIKPQRRWPVSLYLRSFCSLLLLVALSLLMLFFARAQGLPIFEQWYLSNTGIVLHLFGGLFLVVGVCYLVWLLYRFLSRNKVTAPRKPLFLLRGMLPILSVAWILLFTVAIILDLVQNTPYALLLIAVLIGVSFLIYVRFHLGTPEKLLPGLSMTLAIVLILSLALHQVFPGESRAELGACAWRNSLSSVIHGEELGLDNSPVEAVSYSKEGSLFAERTEYWEEREKVSLSSTLYRCRGDLFRRTVQRDLLQTADWQPVQSDYDECWSAQQGKQYKVLLRAGSQLLLLSSEQELLPLLREHPLTLS